MFLLLLFAYLAHNATQAFTIPVGCESQSEALHTRLGEQYFDDRTVWNIVWSCLATLFACSWVAVHPNVPRATDSEALILGRRLATMGYMLLAPELVICWAAKQHFSAKEIAAKYPAKEWTRTHAFFILMGGFALHDADNSFLRVLDERTFEELNATGEIEWPTITVKEIQDRSKADIFSKGIVLLQTTWFIIQCVSRFATKLAVTELEVVTLAFAVLNAITYWLWWDKPLDVRCAVPVCLKSADESSNLKVSEARRKRDVRKSLLTNDNCMQPTTTQVGFLASLERRRHEHGLFLRILYTLLSLLWVPIKVIFGHLSGMVVENRDDIPDDDDTRIPTFYAPLETNHKKILDQCPSEWTTVGVVFLFGAVHFIPWPSTFPTPVEEWLWRASVISITGGPLLILFLIAVVSLRIWIQDLDPDSPLKSIALLLTFIFIIAVYIISRIVLLILPLTLLRSLPPTALLELKWSEFFPHI